MTPRIVVSRAFALIALVALAACGGDSSLGPSRVPAAASEVVLRGTVAGGGVSALSGTSTAATLTVTVEENPAIKVTVEGGTFTLRGLPTGAFTLIFSQDGVVVGSLRFGEVMPSQQLTITVAVTSAGVQLLEESRNGVGHGDVEIEGLIGSIVVLSETADSRILVDGKLVVIRPGETSVRQGNTAFPVTALAVGQRVHVKGTWLPLEGTTQPVLALEVKLQDTQLAQPSPSPNPASCAISGGRVGDGIELEGNVSSGSSAGFRLQVNGNRSSSLVDVDTAGASFQCTPASGPNAPTPAQCQASVASGAKVHVRGTLTSCSASAAQVRASEVRVQK
ncbi:MAG: hypothetical protein AB7O37_16955 [Vicinamibacteria bacterium]